MLRGLAGVLGAAGLVTLVVPLPAGARSGGSFIEGSGTARATALELAPRTGGLTYSVTTGETIASYQGTEGRAQAQALDLGILGLLLTTVSVCGQSPPLKQDQLPSPVQVNSSHGPSTASHSLVGGDLAGGGSQAATAHPDSSAADAATTLLAIPGVLTVGTITSHADTLLVPGSLREAHAEVSVASVDLAGGIVQLVGLHWDVTQHTGSAPVSAGGFHVDQVRVAGQTLPSGLLDGVPPLPGQGARPPLDQANAALAPAGMRLTPPSVRTAPDGTVEVEPLRISVGGSTALSTPLGAALAAAQPGRDALLSQLRGDPQSCRDPRSSLGPLAGAGLLLADIAYGGLTGTGGLDIALGGVHAVTEGIAYRNPFGSLGPPPALLGGASTSAGSAPSEVSGVAPPPVPPRARASTTLLTPATVGRSFTACLSTSSIGGGCARDLAHVAAGAGLGVAAVLFATDALLMVRRRRLRRGP
jgi:hypothetical protein